MRFVVICLAILATGPAHALSCLRPDAVHLFERARDADEGFYIVKGKVTLLEAPNLPPPGSETPTETNARIDGTALSRGGFRAPFSRAVTIRTNCLGPWCASLDGLEDALIMAVEVSGEALSLRIGPCGGDQVLWDQSSEDRLLACYRDGNCIRNF